MVHQVEDGPEDRVLDGITVAEDVLACGFPDNVNAVAEGVD